MIQGDVIAGIEAQQAQTKCLKSGHGKPRRRAEGRRRDGADEVAPPPPPLEKPDH